jgi:hypothetical protein
VRNNLLKILGMASLVALSILFLRTTLISGAKECGAGCVTTHHYDASRDDVNPKETILKASNLSSLHAGTSPDLQGMVFTQPLYVSNLVMSQGTQNVVFVATEENWVYALDGDHIKNPPFWQTNLNNANETSVPVSELPGGCTTLKPEVGVTSTPAIDLTKNLMYVVSSHFNTSTETITQRLNVLQLASGAPAAAALDIPAAFQSISFSFDASVQQQRAGLGLAHDADGNSLIYVAWASYCDLGNYTGKLGAFKFSGTLSAVAGFDDEGAGGGKPVGGPRGGIWMGGVAPPVVTSSAGTPARVFASTGNGSFLAGSEFGESVLQFGGKGSTGPLDLTGSYTAHAWNLLNVGSGSGCHSPLNMPPPYPPGTTICGPGDYDLGSGGVLLARPSGTGNTPRGDPFVVLAGGKEGVMYVIDPSKMNHTSADTKDPCGRYAIQCFGAVQLPLPCCKTGGYGMHNGAAFWAGNATYQENVLYVMGSHETAIRAYQMNPGGGGTFNTSLFASAPPPDPDQNGLIPYPGASPVVTWDSTNGKPEDAILWILDESGSTKAKLFAYQAVPSTQGGTLNMVWSDITSPPKVAKFMVPTVINGHVYVGGGNPTKACTAGSCLGRVVQWQ